MALKDEFEKRFSTEYRIRISNPDVRGASAQNDTLVAQAVTDATAEFPQHLQVAYDATVVAHIQLAVLMVEMWLLRYGAVSASVLDKKQSDLEKRIELARKTIGGRKRVSPLVTGRYAHSVPDDTRRPEFDDEVFEEKTLLSPSTDTPDPDEAP